MDAGTAGCLPDGSVVAAKAIADADWILLSQLPDGAICQWPDKSRIEPYLADYAALGLAHAYSLACQARHLQAAWAWLDWYASHETAAGYVTTYAVAPDGGEISSGTFDSTDAYAGVFLLATREAWRASGDANQLARLANGISGAVSAIESTQQANGLTWATPTYPVEYLMDVSEVYAGLVSAVELAQALDDSVLAARALADANRVQSGFASLWEPDAGLYALAENSDGTLDATSWSTFYPDALAELWGIALGGAEALPAAPLIDPSEQSALATAFLAAWPMWGNPGALIDDAGTTIGYWPVVAWALNGVGRATEANQGISTLRAAALDAGRAWIFNVANAGQLIFVEPD